MKTSVWILFVASYCSTVTPLASSLVYDGNPSVDGGVPSSTAAATSTSANIATRLRQLAGDLAQHVPPWVKQRFLQAPVSTECSLGLLRMMRGFSNFDAWAMRMLDSTGKVHGNVFMGSTTELGSFDECLATVAKDESGIELVRAQYCSFYLRTKNDTSVLELLTPALLMTHPKARTLVKHVDDPRVPGFRWGICVVSDCSEEDLEALGRALVGDAGTVSVKYCTTGVSPVPTTSQIAVAAVLGAIGLLMAAGTIADICFPKEGKSNVGVLRSFSVPANLRMLGTRNNKASPSHRLLFMDGMRAVSIYNVVLGHAAFDFAFTTSDTAFLLSYLDRYDSPLAAAAFMAVDTFFFLSGYLLIYMLHGVKNSRGVKATAVIILRRWYRLLLPLVVVACGFSLLPLLVTGPTTAMVYDKFYNDMQNRWWTFVLKIRNLYRDLTYGVASHTWFISADFQLFLVALLVYQITQRRRVIVAAFSVLSAASCCFTAWQVYGTKYTPILVILTETFGELLDNITDVYMLPTYHAACYFGGCITFYAVEHYKNKKISKGVEAALWGAALGLGTACIFYKYEWTRGTRHGDVAKVLMALGDRVVWASALAALCFLCVTGRGGVVQRALSAAPLAVLSRLSFGVYLIHFPFYFLSNNAMRVKKHLSVFTWFSESVSTFVWSCLLALLLFLAIDAPVSRLDKIIWGTRQKATRSGQAPVAGLEDQERQAEAVEQSPGGRREHS
ncbi:nose resistant to fluoxetine protein 6-like [Amblyomma americanum]